jgi:hypothetical protein
MENDVFFTVGNYWQFIYFIFCGVSWPRTFSGFNGI